LQLAAADAHALAMQLPAAGLLEWVERTADEEEEAAAEAAAQRAAGDAGASPTDGTPAVDDNPGESAFLPSDLSLAEAVAAYPGCERWLLLLEVPLACLGLLVRVSPALCRTDEGRGF
jgi:hypothetical protein